MDRSEATRTESQPQRGLSTARSALQVTWLLAAHPGGVRADEVAEALGKSVSTAYNVLASLCEEAVAVRHPGGRYRLAPAFRDAVVDSAPRIHGSHDFTQIVDELLARTHKRSYLGVVRNGHLVVILERGHQGMPRMPGMEPEIRSDAHALALGKVVLALAPPRATARYLAGRLQAFTPHTITRPGALHAELAAIRRTGLATDREEFREDFCCLAAPVLDDRGRFLAVVGISMSRRAFDTEREALETALLDVVRTGARRMSGPRFQPYEDRHELLESPRAAVLASRAESTPGVTRGMRARGPVVTAKEQRRRPS
jgi:DNA-binding IclR family transcriptional regulator